MFSTNKIKKALLIGNIYKNNEHIYLKHVKEDINRINDLLINKLNFKSKNITTYIDPTNIKKKLNNFLCNVCDDDLIFIFYAGHGDTLVKSTKLSRKIGLLSSWFDVNMKLFLSYELDKMLSNIKNRCKIILMCDSCYSGSFIDYYNGKNPIYFIGSSKSSKTRSYKINDKPKSGGLIILLEWLVCNDNDICFDKILSDTKNYRTKNRFLTSMIVKSKNI